ncbi:MAG TPA: mechanosensitive ion channel family protein, partial [Epsilonproteobacteria bacterium]|nr:mechanosensitive ion channel family protein [Campylobacterota bacterium]
MPITDANITQTKALNVIVGLDMNLDHTVQTILAPFYNRFPVLAESLLGIPLGNLLAAILVLLIFLGLRRFFTYIMMETLQKLAKYTETYYDDKIISALKGPVSFAF